MQVVKGHNKQYSEKLRNIVRVRDINNGEKYILTWKGKATLADGISKVREEETELTKEIGQEILRDPSRIAKYSGEYPLIKHIFSVIGAAATPETAWKVVGEFKTLRLKIPWTSETVELDETTYPFGTGWEIEIETTNPEQVKKQMESLLNENGIAFTESKRNKFLNLINGTII